jgi:hypothetical protein
MMISKSKKGGWLKKALLITVLLIIAGIGIYWYWATDRFADTKNRKSAYELGAQEMISEFEKDMAVANGKYSGKIITVTGIVSEIERADTTMNILFKDTISGSYAIFTFQQQHQEEAKTVKPGDSISIKGACSGAVFSPRRQITSIAFQRSTLNK